MTDWKTMDAGRELDRLIAERLGWTDLLIDQDWIEVDGKVEDVVRVLGVPPGAKWKEQVSEYSTSADAALTLFPDDTEWMATYSPYYGPRFRITVGTPHVLDDEYFDVYGNGDTLALALCRAWMAWREAGARRGGR